MLLHPLAQQVDPMLQQSADARIVPGFDQFPCEIVLFVGRRAEKIGELISE